MVRDNEAFKKAFVTGGYCILRTLDAFSLALTKFTPDHRFRISHSSPQRVVSGHRSGSQLLSLNPGNRRYLISQQY
jgi:hypothetical protein